jgi:hypothetical protein
MLSAVPEVSVLAFVVAFLASIASDASSASDSPITSSATL